MPERPNKSQKKTIPVCEPFLNGKEKEYVLDCIKTNWISSRGSYINEFEEKFADFCNCKYGISTTSGTTALHLALVSLGIGPGDQVIIPTYTMVATAFAVIYTGAEPVLVDSEPRTWNIDINKIEEKITSRTRAIMPVHIYGHPCDMDPITKIAKKYGLYIVEDAAEAHGAEYKGRKTGSLGHINCFSFYANKIITTGEGGMVVTNDRKLAEKARQLKDLSHSPSRRFMHNAIGYNYRMTNLQAALGLAQFNNINHYIEARRRNAYRYNSLLKDIPGIELPREEKWAKNVYWMYSILINNEFGINRDDFMIKLKSEGIETRAFFTPMHRQPVLKKTGYFKKEKYPVSEKIEKRGLYLPSSSSLSDEDIQFICKKIRKIKNSIKLH